VPGQRRRRRRLDLDAGTLPIEVTRVVVDGQVIESDGKTENAQHVLALYPFTLAALKAHVEKFDHERRELGPDYQDHGVLFCWQDGRRPHVSVLPVSGTDAIVPCRPVSL
jgi:hypothetical protein